VVQYQAVIQLAQSAPQIYNIPQLHRQMIDVLGIKNADKLVPLEDDQKPRDPVRENMAALKGKPLKAFIYQDHESHIKVHQMAMQDPLVQQMIGQNPQAQAIQGAMMAHIAEHLGFAYRSKIEQAMGAPLPAPDAEMPEDMEIQISQLVAQAAPQVLAQSQATVAQQQAQQNQQDPVMQAQLIDQQVKQGELQRKIAKDKQDATFKQQELALKAQEVKQEAFSKTANIMLQAEDKRVGKHKATADIALQTAQIQQQDRHHKVNTAKDLFTHQSDLLNQQTQQGGTEE
jgi:hypothetical protein